jgi:ribosome-binding protein aMBF1 (putative translation factor)
MGLFIKHCEICGKKIEKGNDIVRYGKHFDSEEHAKQYVKYVEERKQRTSEESAHHGSGCCC